MKAKPTGCRLSAYGVLTRVLRVTPGYLFEGLAGEPGAWLPGQDSNLRPAG